VAAGRPEAATTKAVDEGSRSSSRANATIGIPEDHHRSMLRHALPFVATVIDADDILRVRE